MLLLFSLLSATQIAQTQPSFARNEKLAIRAVTVNRSDVPRSGKFEISFDLPATYDNPFDPEEVEAWAVFDSPSGKSVPVNAFYWQDFTRKLVNGAEKIEPKGDPQWKVRFAPGESGRWRYRLFARDRKANVSLPAARFRVTASSNPGFVQRSKNNPRVFAFAGEKPFVPIGLNVCWGGGRGAFDYDDWLPALGKAGGNWIRIWMSSWNCALEWSREGKGEWRAGGYHGVGVYSLDNAWKLDAILDTAEQNGIYVMLCLGTYGEFTEGGYFGEGQWKANPYNKANGGPCEKPDNFWTSAAARKLYQRRLRYLAARYGYRTGLHSWEFWNEVPPKPAWTAEMARFLKGTGEFAGTPADPHGHLVTTSYGDGATWRTPELDFSQTHHYGMGNVLDHAPVIHNDAKAHAAFNKPHLMGEYGLDWRKSDIEYDPEGRAVNFHNGIWASLASGNGGSAMLWWWDNYVHPKNLWGTLTPLRRFADTIPWTAAPWKPLEFDDPRVTEGEETFHDLQLTPGGMWGKSEADFFTIAPNGVAGGVTLPSYLYSPGKADLRTTPTFKVNFPRAGRFVARVDSVSNWALLRLLLNGKPVKEARFDAAPPKDPGVKPEYEKTEFQPQWQIYLAQFNKEVGMDVPAGEHAITLDNADGDWMTLSSITLTGYRSSRFPQMRLYGMTNGKTAILWAQNALHNWKNMLDKKPVPVVQKAEVVVRGLAAGQYAVEWWDTRRGEVIQRDAASCVNGALTLKLPDVANDVAAKLEIKR